MSDKPDLIAEFLKKGRSGQATPEEATQANAGKGGATQTTLPQGNLSDLINTIRQITATDEYAMEFLPGATDEEIKQFEKDNNISLPELLKEWLHFTDGCCLFNTTVQLYGVAHKPYIDSNPSGIAENCVEIGKFGFGDSICITSNSQMIIQYGESVIEYDNFKGFLELVIKIGERN